METFPLIKAPGDELRTISPDEDALLEPPLIRKFPPVEAMDAPD
jgi:hypothetical protein